MPSEQDRSTQASNQHRRSSDIEMTYLRRETAELKKQLTSLNIAVVTKLELLDKGFQSLQEQIKILASRPPTFPVWILVLGIIALLATVGAELLMFWAMLNGGGSG
ncbi:MAG: hypothetical protein AAF267_01460 [Deinococcota bacterium]